MPQNDVFQSSFLIVLNFLLRLVVSEKNCIAKIQGERSFHGVLKLGSFVAGSLQLLFSHSVSQGPGS